MVGPAGALWRRAGPRAAPFPLDQGTRCGSGGRCCGFRNLTLWPFVWMPLACSEEAGIPEGGGQCWMSDRPCESVLLPGSTAWSREERCQHAVICKEEIGFTDIINTTLRSRAGPFSQTIALPCPSLAYVSAPSALISSPHSQSHLSASSLHPETPF